MFPENIRLTDLLTFFLFVDLIVMLAVGIYSFKTRNKKGKTEQLLEKIYDLLTQKQPGCTEKPTNKNNSDLTKNVKNALKKVVEPKEEAVEEKPPESKPKQEVPMSIDRERIYYEIEESTEAQTDESTDLQLVKNALKDEPVIKPLLKMPKYIDDLVNKNRQNETRIPQTEVATSAEPIISSVPPPPPPVPTQTTKNNERKESD